MCPSVSVSIHLPSHSPLLPADCRRTVSSPARSPHVQSQPGACLPLLPSLWSPSFQYHHCSCLPPSTRQARSQSVTAVPSSLLGEESPTSPLGPHSVCPQPPAWAHVTLRSADPPLCLGLGCFLDVPAPEVLPGYFSFD